MQKWLMSIVYLFFGYLYADVKQLLTKLEQVKQIMTSNLDQILENQRALTTALNELSDAQQKTLDELKKEIEALEQQGADESSIAKLNEILESQQAAIDTLKRLKAAANEAEPKLQALLQGVNLPQESEKVEPTAPPANFPAQVPPPMHHPVSVSTESVEAAKGFTSVINADGSTTVKDSEGNVVAEEDLPKNFKK